MIVQRILRRAVVGDLIDISPLNIFPTLLSLEGYHEHFNSGYFLPP